VKLHSPGFERTLRQQVKQAVRRSPELKREFRQAKGSRRHYNLLQVLRPFYGVVLALGIWATVQATGHMVAGLAVINLWLLTLLCAQVPALLTRFYAAPELHTLILLPLSRAQIFRWQLQKHFRQSFYALLDLVIAFGALAYLNGFAAWQWPATLLVAVLAWVLLLALIAFCAARFPRRPFQMVFHGLIVMGLVFFIGRGWLGAAAITALDHGAPALNLILPMGWAVSLFQLLTLEHAWWVALLLLPVAAVIGTLKHSLRRLLADFEYQEPVWNEASDVVPAAAPNNGPETSADQPVRLGLTAIAEIIQIRAFLAAPRWPQNGWLEQKLWRWLNQRERALSEFVFPDGIVLTAVWLSIFRNLFITGMAALALGFISPTFKSGALALGLFVTFCQALAQTINQGRAFQPMRCSGVNTPMYAGFGVGFRELSRLLFKYSIIQAPVVLAYTLVAGVAVALLTDFTAATGLMVGLKSGGLLLACRFILVTLAFSTGTNDTAKIRFRSLALVFLLVTFGIIFIGFGVACLFIPNLWVAGIFWVLALLDAWLFHWVYQWFYHSGRFDLMSLPQ